MSDCTGRTTLPATWLGDVELSPHAVLRNLYDAAHVTYEDKRTIGGALKYRAARSVKGRKLVLDLLENHTTVGELMAVLAVIDAAVPVLLRHHVWEGMVRVDAVQSASLPIDYADYNPADWASAEILLTEV